DLTLDTVARPGGRNQKHQQKRGNSEQTQKTNTHLPVQSQSTSSQQEKREPEGSLFHSRQNQ
ncbi:hypothetical protein, partial [Pseudomonas sp. C11]|uniref:hypothetical protein n=1 Tax=Pseudomonas sp. C11 TaxID=3075550 RepID=UPI002AFF2444